MPKHKGRRQKCAPRTFLISTDAKVAGGELKLPEPPPFELLSPNESVASAAREKYLNGFAEDEDFVVVSHEDAPVPEEKKASKPK